MQNPTGASCTSMVGRFQDGWHRVIWKWNKSVCALTAGGLWGVERDSSGGVCCLLYSGLVIEIPHALPESIIM